MMVHDLIGIGFGPSNIALAIALDEERQTGKALNALFIEKQPGFAWHKDMLLGHAHMQISFLKDLVTLRNPTSAFTFVNYLHQKSRLPDFINLKTFFPSRHEFNDYLAWAAAHFDDQCAYGEEVFDVQPEHAGQEVTLLRVRSRDAKGNVRERLARNLVLGLGGTPRIPEDFRALRGDTRVLHSSGYLRDIARNPQARRIAVIGAGQSAAEIFMDLHGRHADTEVDLIMRARAIKPADDSPFSNQIFDAEFVDHVYNRSTAERDELLREFWHTNYACPDLNLIEQIFQVFYHQRVSGNLRHRFLRRHQVAAVQAQQDGIRLTLHDLNSGLEQSVRYDAVVLATGYERAQHQQLLAPLSPYLQGFDTERNYRLKTHASFRPQIFLQGACEHSHGLSDTLLSLTSVRSGEICEAMLAKTASKGQLHVEKLGSMLA
ncbi:lysine N(6)-hydroxylase/L-ornithine N(5)-oxygenase family protein [Chitinolyticbacter meiyuanensis]|uniref:lysine N(6)-hydroxylase/L-ornithine N(5)-oxygenase family protein n=1 Tax=Chitinolyticbacter meiyuanensis TaxID=682798 RepID=UPI0011E5888A|nr:lysine N(6)-hydroxylase/L-ornithine N(5)-oxygenase family protein [Chitinolyticbacter meiyuanensis]